MQLNTWMKNISLGLGSILIILGLVHDVRFYSISFMDDQEIKIPRRMDDDEFFSTRKMASVSTDKDGSAAIATAGNLNLSKELINGKWLILEKTSNDKQVSLLNLMAQFELKKSDQDTYIQVDWKGRESLSPNESLPQQMDVLYIRQASAQNILIYLVDRKKRDLAEDSDVEVYEAKKIVSAQNKLLAVRNNEGEQTAGNPHFSSTPEVSYSKDNAGKKTKDLTLSSVIPMGNGQWFLQGDSVQGGLKIGENRIENLSATFMNSQNEEFQLEIKNAQITNNYFQYTIEGSNGEVQPVSGVINQFGAHEYVITLINGPLVGTKLKFADAGATENQEQNQNQNQNQNQHQHQHQNQNHHDKSDAYASTDHQPPGDDPYANNDQEQQSGDNHSNPFVNQNPSFAVNGPTYGVPNHPSGEVEPYAEENQRVEEEADVELQNESLMQRYEYAEAISQETNQEVTTKGFSF